jgi:hypothetical protein
LRRAVLAGFALLFGASGDCFAADAPPTLAGTGLYADPAQYTIAAEVRPFSPQYPLWSDGASKRRWILLPADATIDASDTDAWVFPVGTRIWKEFAFARRIETRFMKRTQSGDWLYATYRWNEEETEARLVSPRGVRRAAESRPGVPYGLPGVVECRACHESGLSPVLGFSALQLSSDRDLLAPHSTPPEPGALDLDALVSRGLVSGLPAGLADHAPRIDAATPTARAALGYLHANCSNCHNRRSTIARLGRSLTVRADGTPEALESVGQESHYRPTGTEISERVVAGDPDGSLLTARVSSRDPARQMPPMDTHLVDEAGLALLRRWIAEELTPPPAPASEAATNPLARSSGTIEERHP